MSINKIFSKNNVLLLSSANGALAGLEFNGQNVLVPAGELFLLQFLDKSGDALQCCSSDFKSIVWNENSIEYTGNNKISGLLTKVTIREENGFYYFKFKVENIPDNLVLEWLDGVCPNFTGGTMLWPNCEGVEITDFMARENSPYSNCHPIRFPRRGTGMGCFYPGEAQMQFLARYHDGVGIYFAAHDSTNTTKAVEYVPQADGSVRLSLQTFTDSDFGVSYESTFEYVLGGFAGGWMEACEIYRNWVDSLELPKPERALPCWIDDSPVTLIYPVRGDGDDKGSMAANQYFPYNNAMPLVRDLAQKFDSRVMALLMHWEGTAPWAPPYVWPPLGGEKIFSEFKNSLHKEGHLLGVYCSGTAWTQRSCITSYSCEDKFENENLIRYMMRGPKGEIEATICNGEQSQRLGYDLCLAEEWSRQTVMAEIRKIAKSGVDYAQYFDQNLGGQSNFCYSGEHDHPPVPGRWQVDTMRRLLEDIDAMLAADNSRMVLGCEAAAAMPYLDILQFSDARPANGYGKGMPVPAYAFVFHDRVNSFMGNQCGIGYFLDLETCPENLLYRTAYSFNAGDMLSVVLKDNGRVHWGWVLKWDFPEPDQASIITLIRNLNATRKKYLPFLQYGRMQKPKIKVIAPEYELALQCSRKKVNGIFHSRWQSPDNQTIEVVTNFLPYELTIGIALPDDAEFDNIHNGKYVLPPLSATVFREISLSQNIYNRSHSRRAR